MSVCRSVTLVDCAQTRRDINVRSLPYDSPILPITNALIYRLTAVNPFSYNFPPKVTRPGVFCPELDRNVTTRQQISYPTFGKMRVHVLSPYFQKSPCGPSVCVCLSQVGVRLKRLYVGSQHQQCHTIAHGL